MIQCDFQWNLTLSRIEDALRAYVTHGVKALESIDGFSKHRLLFKGGGVLALLLQRLVDRGVKTYAWIWAFKKMIASNRTHLYIFLKLRFPPSVFLALGRACRMLLGGSRIIRLLTIDRILRPATTASKP